MVVIARNKFITLSLAIMAAGFGSALIPKPAFAAAFSVTPLVIDKQAHARDIIKDHIVFHNTSGRELFIYTSVNDVSDASGAQKVIDPALADRSSSLSSWISISRGFQLAPGETKSLDWHFEVNLDAKPGVYHAQMTFTEGTTQAEAESNKAQGVMAAVNVTVLDSSREQSDLLRFVQDKAVFLTPKASFSYTVKNSGDVPLTPTGEISIYNRGGEEVATLPVNSQNLSIAPGDTAVLHSVWQPAPGLGRYKAIIRLKYGEKDPQILTDVIFFTLLPWPLLLVLIGLLFLTVFTLLYLVNRHDARVRLANEARLQELLAAGRRKPAAKRNPAKPRKANPKAMPV